MADASFGDRPPRRSISTWRESRAGRLVRRVLLYGSAILLGLPLALSYALTRAPGPSGASSPPPGYRAARFRSETLELRGWLAPGRTDRPAVVVVHGLGDSAASYVEHAEPFLARGHAVLLVNLRGHGGSDGRFTTLGGRESNDVRAAMRFLREQDLADAGFVLLGTSMGAVAVLLAAAEASEVRAVVAEAPFDSYRRTVAHHARLLFGLPEWAPLVPLTVWFAERWAGFDADDVDAVAAAGRIRAPLLAIVCGDDDRMPEPVVRRVVDAHRGPNELWLAEGVGHAGAILHPGWERTVIGFLEANGIELGDRTAAAE